MSLLNSLSNFGLTPARMLVLLAVAGPVALPVALVSNHHAVRPVAPLRLCELLQRSSSGLDEELLTGSLGVAEIPRAPDRRLKIAGTVALPRQSHAQAGR